MSLNGKWVLALKFLDQSKISMSPLKTDRFGSEACFAIRAKNVTVDRNALSPFPKDLNL